MTRHIAVAALAKSVLINMLALAVLYRLAQPHFPTDSLLPLAISGLPPVWLAYSAATVRAVDWLGLFAAENVAVAMAALLLAHTERQALIGRAMQNLLLAGLFMASLMRRRPLVLHMARQLVTGNDPAKKATFDAAAERPGALHAYRVLTIGWVVAMLIKGAGTYYLGDHLPAKNFLLLSPAWDLVRGGVCAEALYLRSRRPARHVHVELQVGRPANLGDAGLPDSRRPKGGTRHAEP
ncbi:MAG: hypothetical protein WA840_16365 [Caulobacteraceae bacterium]